MAEYKIQLGVVLDNTGLQNIRNQISALERNSINIRLNDRDLLNQISNIRQQIQQLNNIRITLGGNGRTGRVGGFAGFDTMGIYRTVEEVNRAYEDLKRLQTRIGSIRIQIAGLDATKNSTEIQDLSAQLNRLMTDYNNLYSAFNNRFSTDQLDNLNRSLETTNGKVSALNSRMSDTTAIRQQTQAYNDLLSISKQIGSLELKIAGLRGQGGNVNQIAELETQLRTLQTTYQQMVNTLQTPLTADQWSKVYTDIAKTQDKLRELDSKIADTRAKLAKKIEVNLESGKFSAQVTKVHNDANKLSTVSEELKKRLAALRNAESAMSSAFKNNDVNQKIKSYENYRRILESVQNLLKQNKIIEQSQASATSLNQAKSKLSLDMDNWLKNNSAAAKEFGGRIRELQAQIKNCDKTTLSRLRAEFVNIQKQAQLAGKNVQTLGDRLKAQFSKYSSYFSVATVFMYTTRALRSMFNQVKAIDSAMTELKKVTDETAASYDKFLTNAASRAKEIGTTIDGIVNSTADFARLGYGFEDAQGLAEVANIYAVVGDEIEGVEQATESLISTMAAYKDEAVNMSNTDFAMSIIDKFNEIGKLIA